MAVTVGWTVFNDPPPGAGRLNSGEYCFAELGTAKRTDGSATGVGNLARALGMPGELPMGAHVVVRNPGNGRQLTIVKQDRGYGQGGDGIHSDPAYAIDLWDGTAYGGLNAGGALGVGGKGTGMEVLSVNGSPAANGTPRGGLATTPTARLIKVPVAAGRSPVRAPQADLDVSNITLQGKPFPAKLAASITDLQVAQTIAGASTLTITIADLDYQLLRSQLLKNRLTVNFDGLVWVLVKMAAGDDGSLALTFEEEAVNLLRQYSSPKKSDRATGTRAQFVRSMIVEVREKQIPYSIPEVNVRQPIA